MSIYSQATPRDRMMYVHLPLIILVPSILMYFSGVPWMVELICPSINWEFGVIENVQLLILLYMVIISAIAAVKKDQVIEKLAYGFLAVFALFIFFEEMDWGAHFIEYATGEKRSLFSDATGMTNIHNQDGNAKWFKRPVYLLMATIFIVFPLYRESFRNELLRFLTPQKLIIYTVVIAILADLIPRFTVILNIRPDGGFGTNIGEFSEVMVYWTFALYVRELISRRFPGFVSRS